MTDPDLIAKRLALIETYVRELERLARADLIESDVREERFVEHTLQLAIQAAIDVASHVTTSAISSPSPPRSENGFRTERELRRIGRLLGEIGLTQQT